MKWVFLRHGESQANADDVLSGWTDTPLTHRGITQAEAAAELLRNSRYTSVISSDLQRAHHTATIVHKALNAPPPLVVLPDLRERHLGNWGGESRLQMRENGMMAQLVTWHGQPPEGESQAMVAHRVVPALTPYVGEATLIVCHGGVIRVLLGLIDGEDPHHIGYTTVPNATPVSRDITAEGWNEVCDRLRNAG